MGNIYEWYLHTNKSDDRYYPKKLTKVSDTEYTSRWTLTQYSVAALESFINVQFSIVTMFRLKDDLGNPGKWLGGNDDSPIIIYPNHTYVRDDETHSYARSMTPPAQQEEDKGLTVLVLNSIEDADGNIVWQNPDCPPDDWSEDEEPPFVLHHF